MAAQAHPQKSLTDAAPVQLRRATPEDAPVCGKICFEAFTDISTRHNFPPDFPSPDVAVGLLSMMFAHPGFYGVVAEIDGKIVGSNVLEERSPIAGIGPITVDPKVQNRGAGRILMQAVMDRSAQRGFPGLRLVQAAFHNRSLSLYTALGFDAREPLTCFQGPAICKFIAGYSVRAARPEDLQTCNELCRRVHGHHRGGDLRDAIQEGSATVVESRGRITAYASSISFFGHAVGESNEDVQALIAAAPQFLGPGFLIPTRNSGLFRWCLKNGLRATQPMTLMTIGLYNEPKGSYLPSIAF